MRRTRGRVLIAMAAVVGVGASLGVAGAVEQAPAPEQVHRAMGEPVLLAGCEVAVTSVSPASQPEASLLVETTVSDVDPAGAPGRCMEWYLHFDQGSLRSPLVATSSAVEERGAAPTPASTLFVFETEAGDAGPAEIVFAPEGAGGTQAVWTVVP